MGAYHTKESTFSMGGVGGGGIAIATCALDQPIEFIWSGRYTRYKV